MDKKFIRFLAEIADRFDLTSVSVKEDGFEIEINREKKTAATPQISPAYSLESTAAAVPADIKAAGGNDAETDDATEIKAPMVGVFYSSPRPGDPPYVKAGDSVAKGDVLCIIEAMKIMNEIKAEKSGRIIEVCCKNAELVEYGQTIFKIK